MHNQPADFLSTSLFSRPSERAGATSEGNRVGSLLGVPGGVLAHGCAVSPPLLFGMVDLISDMPAIRPSFQDVAIFSDSLYYSDRLILTTPIFRRGYYKITLLTGSGLVTMPLFTKPIKLRLLFLIHKATVCSVLVHKMSRRAPHLKHKPPAVEILYVGVTDSKLSTG